MLILGHPFYCPDWPESVLIESMRALAAYLVILDNVVHESRKPG